jgi:hypothetical protein
VAPKNANEYLWQTVTTLENHMQQYSPLTRLLGDRRHLTRKVVCYHELGRVAGSFGISL